MAKELPYFKFEPNQWDNGKIQMCSREDKGLFIDICSMYWSRIGDLPCRLVIQKLCGGNESALDSLLSDNIFEVIDDMICINFLNEQLNEFENISKINSNNAKEGWIKRRKAHKESEGNATASKPQSEIDGIREDKKREDKIIEEEKKKNFTPPSVDDVYTLFFEKINNAQNALNQAESFIDYYTNTNWKVGSAKTKMIDWKAAARNWIKKDFNNGTTKNNKNRLSQEQQQYLASRTDI